MTVQQIKEFSKELSDSICEAVSMTFKAAFTEEMKQKIATAFESKLTTYITEGITGDELVSQPDLEINDIHELQKEYGNNVKQKIRANFGIKEQT